MFAYVQLIDTEEMLAFLQLPTISYENEGILMVCRRKNSPVAPDPFVK